uniref:Uncharacterized protein n=1 Tax=Fagus sylvatica TaxID=28930 RepID=A0A2N9HIL0_FAGSY
MVLQSAFPLVSGKTITTNPHNNIVNPKIPKDRNSFLHPTEVNTGSNTEPNAIACLASVVAEFLTLVGNNSTVNIISTLYAKRAQKKDVSSSPICMPFLPLPTTAQIILHMPLVVQKANNETFLFHLAIKNKGLTSVLSCLRGMLDKYESKLLTSMDAILFNTDMASVSRPCMKSHLGDS